MQWIKAHLNVVITVAIGLLGITALVLGIVLPDTAKMMEADQGTLNGLNGVKAVNTRVIEQSRSELKELQDRLEKQKRDLEAFGKYEPIINGVFPKIEAQNSTEPYRFKAKFREKQQQILAKIGAGDQPSKEDRDREADLLANEKAKADREATLGTDAGKGPKAPGRPPTPAPVPGPRVGPGAGKITESLTPEDRAKNDPNVRASLRQAGKVRCYATLANLNPPANMSDTTKPPTLEEMWAAQIMLWVQEDVLGALGRVNDKAAEKLAEKDRNVTNLPVKHLLNMWMGGYVASSGSAGQPRAAAPTGSGASTSGGPPPGDAGAVFTGRSCMEGVDVLHFAIELVLDAQSLPQVLNEICGTGFYTPLKVTYEQLSPVTSLDGFIYGSAPLIKARLEIEVCFLRSKYAKWIPESVVTLIKENRGGELFKESSSSGGTARPSGPTGAER